MDHRNVSMVHDAGAAPQARPYFVIELVKGVPITRLCNELSESVRGLIQRKVDQLNTSDPRRRGRATPVTPAPTSPCKVR